MSATLTENKVGVVIVNWNSFDVLARCLTALKRQTFKPACVIVIDNKSENAPNQLHCDLPDNTQYIKLNENTGFARGNNLGVSLLCECDYIALINPDAFPQPDWLYQLVDAASRNPEYSFFASITIMDDDPEYFDGAGDIYHISGIGWRRGYGRKISPDDVSESEVFAPCAAAAMYSRAAWEEVKGFDEDYFCYFEDVDLAFRLRLQGYKCLLVPRAIAYHVGSVTSGGHRSDFSVYHGHRNLVWTYVKNMPGYAFWLFLPLHISMNLISIFRFIPSGQWRIVLKAKIDALRSIRKVWKKRRSIQNQRRVGVAEIIRFMDKRLIPIRRKTNTIFSRFSGLLPISDTKPALVSDSDSFNEQANYFNYLRRRSILGFLYRKFWLYPKLVKSLFGRVLDVGCGIGDFLDFRPGAIGLDINPYAVEWCKKRGLDARLMEVDHLPFSNDSFDGVVLDNVLEHLAIPDKLIAEIERVLVPGGRVLIGVPGKRGYAADSDHKKFYSEEDLKKTMYEKGFSCKEFFFMPVKSGILDSFLPQYCLYGVFERS